jgi:PIN like domain
MRLLLDEDVPVPFVGPLRRLLPDHQLAHIDELGWKQKSDLFVYRDARRRGFDAVLTNDKSQLADPKECRAIKQSGLHHIRYHHDTRPGLEGLAYAMASVFAAIRLVMAELDAADGQRLVKIVSLQRRVRHEITDPAKDPPPYWPRTQQKFRPRSGNSRIV